jgi:hypothetical protein
MAVNANTTMKTAARRKFIIATSSPWYNPVRKVFITPDGTLPPNV